MKHFLISLAVLLFAGSVSSQDISENPDVISKAVYFDKTPPLREMEVILPGERDRAWKDGIIANKSMEEDFKNQQAVIPSGFTDPALQREYNVTRDIRGPVINLEGVGNVNGVYPPDTDGDVGPNHYFQMINLSFAIWDKQGNLLYGPVDNSTLWNGFIGPWTGTNDGDPIVLYDEEADRWMASQFAINTSNGTYWQLVAISETNDPLGSYYRYAFQFSAFNDYPKMGIWPDAYYATFNMFGSYTRAGVAAFERDSMLVGAPARMVYYDVPGTFSMLPADFDGTPPPAGSPCYFAHLQTFGSQQFEIYEFDVDWSDPGNSSFDLVTSLQPAAYNPNVNGIPQPGTSTELDDLSFMLMFRLQYRNFGSHETLMTNHTVNAGGRAGVRWYEFRKDNADWYIYQQGTFAPDNENRWMASVAMNGNGDIALGYNISGSSTYPSIYYTGRRSYDPLGQMTVPETLVIGGTSSQSGIDRWGDYACMSVDPVDDSTFWFTTEYRGGGWKTRIVSFDFGPILPPEVSAGNDTTICETEPFLTAGQAAYQQSVLWETAGDGFFVDPTDVTAVYLRGIEDVTSGEVDLWVTAYGYEPGTDITDSVTLSFARMAVVNAGNDTTICSGDIVQLEGTASNYDTIYWTTEGDGTFDNDSILNPYYTPGVQDIENGFVRLVLHASDTAPCTNEVFDKMRLNIDQCTFIGERGKDDISVSIIPNPARESFTFTITGVKPGEEVVVDLKDLQGKTVFTQRFISQDGTVSNKISVRYIQKATYLLQVRSGVISTTEKLVVQ